MSTAVQPVRVVVVAEAAPTRQRCLQALAQVMQAWGLVEAVQVQALSGAELASLTHVPQVLWLTGTVDLAVAPVLARWRAGQAVAVVADRVSGPGAAAWPHAAGDVWLASPRPGEGAVCLPGPGCLRPAAEAAGQADHWMETPQAQGWLRPVGPWLAAHRRDPEAAERIQAAATSLALARGFVAADALTLALTVDAQGHPTALPMLSWGKAPVFVSAQGREAAPAIAAPAIYAIVDTAERLARCARHGADVVQLRSKLPEPVTAQARQALAEAIRACVAAAAGTAAQLYINDHRELALAAGARGLHLGQEDLLALSDDERCALRAAGLRLGISSHSVWELARARALAPDYIACGPIWATTTKDMPWTPQGLHNLRWWVAHAGAPVVAIGGILDHEQLRQTAACGAAAVCVVRGLGDDPAQTLPALRAAVVEGHAQPRPPVPALPQPSLLSGHGVPAPRAA